MNDMKKLHDEALNVSRNYRDAEKRLVGLIQDIDAFRGYRELGFTSLFHYVTGALELSESVAFNLISIARKARVVPALKEKIESGEISISNARMIAPVLTLANQDLLLEQAATLPKRELERRVAYQFPERAVRESSRFVAPERIELKVGISPELDAKLKRAQDLVSQSLGKAASVEETIEAMLALFLKHKDPVLKAERVVARKQKTPVKLPVPGQRLPLPAAIKHAVMRRDQGRCTARDVRGTRCVEKRWMDFHHVLPKNRGGTDSVENLALLCRNHHLMHHGTPPGIRRD